VFALHRANHPTRQRYPIVRGAGDAFIVSIAIWTGWLIGAIKVKLGS
jgi:hypothetical protein